MDAHHLRPMHQAEASEFADSAIQMSPQGLPRASRPSERRAPSRSAFNAAQLKIIRATIARELNQAEFDQFMETAARTGLDPLRRQIVPLLLNRSDPERRALAPITTIDGLRAIAARTGDYHPMETPARLVTRKTAVDLDTNPLGLIRAEVRVWKFDGDQWRPVAGEAWWDEYAPLRPAPEGHRGHPGQMVLAEPWRRMARVMIAKCAEAQALRRGWPEDLSGLYGPEEMARAQCEELTASERLAQLERMQGCAEPAGSKAVLLALSPNGPLERVTLHEAKERLLCAYEEVQSVEDFDLLEGRNREGLRQFWTLAQAAALEVKQAAEGRRAELEQRGAS